MHTQHNPCVVPSTAQHWYLSKCQGGISDTLGLSPPLSVMDMTKSRHEAHADVSIVPLISLDIAPLAKHDFPIVFRKDILLHARECSR